MPLAPLSDQKLYPSGFFTGGSLAYLVGMNGYRFVPALDSPKNDCLGLEQVLQDKHGFTTTTVFDADRQGVLSLLEQIKQDCKAKSRVIFYFAGHGIADGADDANQRPKGFLLAVDSERGKEETYIEMGHVLEVLVALPCSHLLIILDCCYAGAIRYAEQTRSIGSSVPKTLYAEKFTYYIDNPAKQVITSAACDQKAMDALGSRGALNTNRRSPFAESLIHNLEKGDRDWSFGHIQPDGIVTASELGYFLGMEVSDQLSKNNVSFAEQQTPSVFRIGDRTKGEFIFINSQDAIKRLTPNPVENPWKGLADYSIKDNHLFYGRQRVLDGWWEGKTQYKGLLQLVSQEENIHKILVTGRSGSGKSSLVKAGVLARLQEESPGSVTTIAPGNTPYSTHSELLKQLKNKPGKVYLMVDQYEELVTVCNDPIEQANFEKSLANIAALPDAKVIITLRSDLERRFIESPFLNTEQGGDVYRFVVPPFSREEIHEVVIQPAVQQLLEFRGNYSGGSIHGDSAKSQDQADERFVNRIIDETFANPDALPLLSFALSRLFEMKNAEPGNLLAESDYDDFGGISGILDKKLTDAYNTYDAGHQALFRQLIYRMISFDAGYMAKRRVYTKYTLEGKTLDELEFADATTTAATRAVQQELVKQRLLKTSRENEAAGTKDDNIYFEPAHEALLRSSNLISEWQSEPDSAFQGRIILLNAVSAAAKNYYLYEDKVKKGNLWKDDPRLDLVKRMWDGRELYLNSVEETFIVESLRARTRAKRILWTAVIAVFILLSAASVFSYRQKLNADDNAAKAQSELLQSYESNSREALSDNDQLRSYLFLAEAVAFNKEPRMNRLLQSNGSHYFPSAFLWGVINTGSDIKDFKLTADDKLLIIHSDSSISVWDTHSRQKIFSVAVKASDDLQFSADNEIVLIHSDASIAIWNFRNKPKVFTVAGKAGEKFLSSNGSRLYKQNGAIIECWDILHQSLINRVNLTGNPKIIWNMASNRFLVSLNTKLFMLDSELNRSSWALPGDEPLISANGIKIAAVTSRQPDEQPDSVTVWDVSRDQPKLVYKQKVTDYISTRALSPTGKYLILANNTAKNGREDVVDIQTGKFFTDQMSDGLWREYNPAEDRMFYSYDPPGPPFLVLDLHTLKRISGEWGSQGVLSARFFPADAKNYSDSVLIDGRMYNSKTGRAGTDFNNIKGYSAEQLIDWKGRSVISYAENGMLRIDSLQHRASGLSFFTAAGANPKNVVVAADGKIFAAGGQAIYIYDHIKPTETTEIKNVSNCYFSDDGKHCITVDTHSVATLWELDDDGDYKKAGRPINTNGSNISNDGVSFSSDGRLALSTSYDANAYYLWDFEKGKCRIIFKIKNSDHRLSGNATLIENEKKVIFSDDAGSILSYDLATGKSTIICHLPHQFDQVLQLTKNGKFAMVEQRTSDRYPGAPNDTIAEFRLTGPGLVQKGRLPVTIFHVGNQLNMKYIGMDKAIFVNGTAIAVYNLKNKRKENLFSDFKPLSFIGEFKITNDTSKLIVFYDNTKYAVLDLNTGKISATVKIDGLPDDRSGSFVINKDQNQLAVFERNNVHFFDIDGQGMTFNYTDPKSGDDLHNNYNTVFNGYNFYYFNGNSVKLIGADIDLPPDLFKLQAIALTGARLNPATNEPEPVPADELVKIRTAYRAGAATHFKLCQYKKFNLWHQMRGVK